MRTWFTAAAVAILFLLGNGMALADDGPVASTDGSSSQFIDNSVHQNAIKTCDTDPDGDWVYTSYKIDSGSTIYRIEYHGGSTGGGGDGCIVTDNVVKTGKTITYRSCQNDAFADTCSAWKSTTA